MAKSKKLLRILFYFNVVMFVLFFAIAYGIEIVEAVPVRGKFYFFFGIILTLFYIPLFIWMSHESPYKIYFGMLIIAALFYVIPFTPRKTFLKHFNRIKVGMAFTEVKSIMADYQVGPVRPNSKRHYYIWHISDDPRFNNDWGVVTVDNDTIAKITFSLD